MRLVVDATAWQDLDDIATWIAADRPLAGRCVVATILKTIEYLPHFPRLSRTGRVPGTYERVVAGTPFIVVFELWENPEALVVTGVVYARRGR